MKKLILGLTVSLFLIFTAESLSAQVRNPAKQDTVKKDTTMKQTWPADTNGRDTMNQSRAPMDTVERNGWQKDSVRNHSVPLNDTTMAPSKRNPSVPSRPNNPVPNTPASPRTPNNPTPTTPINR